MRMYSRVHHIPPDLLNEKPTFADRTKNFKDFANFQPSVEELWDTCITSFRMSAWWTQCNLVTLFSLLTVEFYSKPLIHLHILIGDVDNKWNVPCDMASTKNTCKMKGFVLPTRYVSTIPKRVS